MYRYGTAQLLCGLEETFSHWTGETELPGSVFYMDFVLDFINFLQKSWNLGKLYNQDFLT